MHGLYTIVDRIISPHQVDVKFAHYQQQGTPLYSTGDKVAFVDRKTLLRKFFATVSHVDALNFNHVILTLEEAVANDVAINDAVENNSKMPDGIIIRRCRTGNNRVRGFLLSAPCPTLIEDCELHNSHHAIYIEGDSNYWYESGPVRDVTIRRCYFRDCDYGFGGTPIHIQPNIKKPEENPECYHQNITIENNRFECFATGLVTAVLVDGLKFRGNQWRKTDTYEAWEPDRPQVKAVACKNVEIQEATPLPKPAR
jgi:hypothetical protein